MSIINAAPITCYTLSCPSDTSNDGITVLDPTPCTYNRFKQIRIYMYQVDYTTPDGGTLKACTRQIQVQY